MVSAKIGFRSTYKGLNGDSQKSWQASAEGLDLSPKKANMELEKWVRQIPKPMVTVPARVCNWYRPGTWQNTHIGFLTHGVRGYDDGKRQKSELLELPLSREILNQKKYMSGRTSGSCHHQGLEECRVGDPTTSPFGSPTGL